MAFLPAGAGPCVVCLSRVVSMTKVDGALEENIAAAGKALSFVKITLAVTEEKRLWLKGPSSLLASFPGGPTASIFEPSCVQTPSSTCW